MKLNRLFVSLMVLAIVSGAAVGQEITGEAFMLQLTAQLSALGWDDDAVAEFQNAAADLDWSGAGNTDPGLVAWALEFGISDDAISVPERVNLALALGTQLGTMTRLGYTDRDVAAAALQATRAATEAMTRWRNESGNPDPDLVGEPIRARVREAMEEQTFRAAARLRTGVASGNIYRLGEAVPGVPLSPDDPPRPGVPGDGASDGTGDPNGPRN